MSLELQVHLLPTVYVSTLRYQSTLYVHISRASSPPMTYNIDFHVSVFLYQCKLYVHVFRASSPLVTYKIDFHVKIFYYHVSICCYKCTLYVHPLDLQVWWWEGEGV